MNARYDVAVVGGGHNGLVAAAYLARAGLSVVVLERLERLGGATVSVPAFGGRAPRHSPYSGLVSLMPDEIISDLGLELRLLSRSTASYAPVVRDGRAGGLLVERSEGAATRGSFRDLTGSDQEYVAWRALSTELRALAHVVAPTLLSPLPLERDVEAQVDPATWRDFVTTPIGATLERRFADDTVRGLVASDALIGTLASLHGDSLTQNRCFLYHMLGNGPGEWRVPAGGMGAVTDALARVASENGAELVTGAGVSSIRPGHDLNEVTFDGSDGRTTVEARFVLANVAPWVLRILLGEAEDPATKPQGSQLKIDFLLARLPRLRSGLDPEVAFAGTLHVAAGYRGLEAAYAEAAAGRLPSPLPGRLTCHSLTDPSILGEAAPGTHTLTYLGLHAPPTLFAADPGRLKAEAVAAAIAAIDEHLLDPLESCVARDSAGDPCIEARTPQDVEAELAMPGGHIFHGDLEWPWASNRARLDSPDQAWGVATGLPSLFLCGSGARRGGAVSGIGGHNAAQAVLASR